MKCRKKRMEAKNISWRLWKYKCINRYNTKQTIFERNFGIIIKEKNVTMTILYQLCPPHLEILILILRKFPLFNKGSLLQNSDSTPFTKKSVPILYYILGRYLYTKIKKHITVKSIDSSLRSISSDQYKSVIEKRVERGSVMISLGPGFFRKYMCHVPTYIRSKQNLVQKGEGAKVQDFF